MDFKRRLAAAIKHKDCDRAALAQALDVSVQAIGLVLSGSSKALTAENCAKAARFLGVDFYWLATGEGEMEAQADWPVQRVDVKRFTALKPEDRGYVEAKIEEAIAACEQRNKGQRRTVAQTIESLGLGTLPQPRTVVRKPKA